MLYILIKGVETLEHILKMLFLYTKNSTLTFYYLEKSVYYYLEFIEQMNQDKNSFLKLNTKDAILFLYKKTIFDINHQIKENHKPNSDDKKVFETLTKLINEKTKFVMDSIQLNTIPGIALKKEQILDNIQYLLNNLIHQKG